MPIGKVLPADREQPQPLRFAETSPYPVGLTDSQCVSSALGPDRTGTAHGLGVRLPTVAGRTTLTVRVEELGAVAPSAQAESLPFPKVGDGPGQSANVRHQHPPPARHRGVLLVRGLTQACRPCTPANAGSHPTCRCLRQPYLIGAPSSTDVS